MKPLDYFYDNPSSGEGHFPQKFCTFFFALIRGVFFPLFRYRAYDRDKFEQLPAGSGAIIVGNHRSYLDPLFVMSVLRPRPVRYVSKEEFLNIHPLIARLATWVGVFPIKRNSADMSAIKRAVRMLKRGELVGIFPEGTRIRFKGQEVTYHEGVALISQLAKVPVIPVRMWGTEHICPEGARLFRCPRITLRFGDPLSMDEERFTSLPKNERFTAFTNEVMERLYALTCPR
jgi:1-acyl-sn-glycerol-3-phosphate acyltransferase